MATGAVKQLGLSLLLTLAWLPAFSASSTQHFDLAGHGELLLSIPDNWRSVIKQPKNGLPPTIRLHTRSGASFEVLITAIWAIPPNDVPDNSKIRSLVADAAKSAEPQSVEGTLRLRELVGPNSRGYYFFATDRAPASGEWKYLTQGATRVGTIALTFTILTNDGEETDAKAALELIRLAAHQSSDAV